jgi:hypothetical protein
MEDTVFLVNERPSILDLSAVTDVNGRRVVLEPRGSARARRECFADAVRHPHVQTMLDARWVRVERRQAQEPIAIARAAATVVVPAEPLALAGEEGSTPTTAAPPEAAMDPPAAEPTHDAADAPGEPRRGKKR